MARKMKWHCYVCGKPIAEAFVLWSLSEKTDRVFLAHEKCIELAKRDNPFVMRVECEQKEGGK